MTRTNTLQGEGSRKGSTAALALLLSVGVVSAFGIPAPALANVATDDEAARTSQLNTVMALTAIEMSDEVTDAASPDEAADIFDGGIGTQDDPYQIATALQLEAFRNAVNEGDNYQGKYLKLTSQAYDLSGESPWEPIGAGTRSGSGYASGAPTFAGTFDGKGAHITGLTIAQASVANAAVGLFGVLDGATVTNFYLDSVSIDDEGSENVGAVAGLMVNNATVSRIEVSGSVAGFEGTGGVIGRMTVEGTVENCLNKATVSSNGSKNIGGIVGAAYYPTLGKKLVIANCMNEGAITGLSDSVGGIVGFSTAYVSDCTNKATVTTTSGPSVGGIVGEQRDTGSIMGCLNMGNVSNKTPTSRAGAISTGGIVGWVRYVGGDKSVYQTINVSNNRNTGSVSSDGTCTGGIIGSLYDAAIVENNVNEAKAITGGAGSTAGVVGTFALASNLQGTPDLVYQNNYSSTLGVPTIVNAAPEGDGIKIDPTSPDVPANLPTPPAPVTPSGDAVHPDPGPTPDPSPWEPTPPEPAPASVYRLAGTEAPQTAIMISRAAFPQGAESVVISRTDDFADAMSATGLAGALQCPILTTDRESLSDDVAGEVARLGAEKVYIIGGPVALPVDLEGTFEPMGVAALRIYGENAWDTSVACAQAIVDIGGNPAGNAIIATSENFQDALSISSYAYRNAVPIFLTDAQGVLPADAVSSIGGLSGSVYVAGGTAVVPAATAEGAFGDRVVRLAGEDGYDTSNQIATYMKEKGLLVSNAVCVASGALPARGLDALSGSALAGTKGAPILLVSGNEAMAPVDTVTISGTDSNGTTAFLEGNATNIHGAYVLGGDVVVPQTILAQIQQTLER